MSVCKELRELTESLRQFHKIVITGPQRSGTRIASKILSTELGYEFVKEEDFVIDNLKLFTDILNSNNNSVIQAPALCNIAGLLNPWNVAVVMCVRRVYDIKLSEKRINWPFNDYESHKYFKDGESCVIKYDAWANYQRGKLKHAYELWYEWLSGHKFYVPLDERKNFQYNQLEV